MAALITGSHDCVRNDSSFSVYSQPFHGNYGCVYIGTTADIRSSLSLGLSS
jgi:hypothetical protein